MTVISNSYIETVGNQTQAYILLRFHEVDEAVNHSSIFTHHS